VYTAKVKIFFGYEKAKSLENHENIILQFGGRRFLPSITICLFLRNILKMADMTLYITAVCSNIEDYADQNFRPLSYPICIY